MNDLTNNFEALEEISKFVDLMSEEADSVQYSMLVQEYLAPILESLIQEVAETKLTALNAIQSAHLAHQMHERTFAGEIITNIASHFEVLQTELETKYEPDSEVAVAMSEIAELLTAWLATQIEDDEDEDDTEDEGDTEDEDDNEDGHEEDSEKTEEEASVEVEEVPESDVEVILNDSEDSTDG